MHAMAIPVHTALAIAHKWSQSHSDPYIVEEPHLLPDMAPKLPRLRVWGSHK